MCIHTQVVNKKYWRHKAVLGSKLSIKFESEYIILDISLEGITLESGWKITPLRAPIVSACDSSSYCLHNLLECTDMMAKWEYCIVFNAL